MTIVQAETFNVDTTLKQLEVAWNATGSPQPIAGGSDAPGIVDLQFVFNLQTPTGGITKVGVPLDRANCKFPDFATLKSTITSQSDPCYSREQDIRTIEIYLLVRSRVKPLLTEGLRIPVQTITGIGDVPQRTTSTTSDTFPSLGAGYIYRVFSTTVYIRNMAREDFG
ncbi:MAG: hypothetical protein C4291_04405 [Candidatus Dadabacteria bacterium]